MSRLVCTLAAAVLLHAGAAAAAQVEDTELPTIGGAYEPLLGTGARANVLVFLRSDQDRSFDALRQLAAAEKDLAGKPVHWVAIVSGGASLENVKAATAATGAQMPVVIDMGDRIYRMLSVPGHPTVLLADPTGKVAAIEPHAQVDFREKVTGRIRFMLGEIDKASLERSLSAETGAPGAADPVKRAMRNVHMARKLHALGLYAKAVKQGQRALELAPVPAAFAVIGASYARLGLCADAKKMLDQAVRADPGSEEAAAARAVCGLK